MNRNIVLLDRATIGPNIKIRPPAFAHNWIEYDDTESDQIAGRIENADIIITNKVALQKETLKMARQVKLIAIAATGYNHIDLETCKERGITVSNITSYANHTVPEHVMTLLLNLFRQVKQYEMEIKKGAWQDAGRFCFFSQPVHDLYGKRLGIFGRGELGQATAKLAHCFGMEVVFAGRKGAHQTKAPYMPFDEVLATADAISLHMPLMPETENLIGSDEFKKMKKHPVVINTARGGIINETALIEALETEQISGAGMDVVTSEPPPADHPFMKLIERPNFILTPHSAWASEEAMQTLADQLIDNIEAFFHGAPQNRVV